MRTLRASSILLSLLATACLQTEPHDREVGSPDAADRCFGCSWGPPVLNTHLLNGLPVDALDLTGASYHGIVLVSITVPTHDGSDVLVAVEAEKGVLFGNGASGNKYTGDQLVGSLWELEDHRFSPAVTTTMEITAFQQEATHARYTFVHSSSATWEKEMANCETDEYTGESSAILLQDLEVESDGSMHDTASILYFGCVSGAVGKAVVWGYSPWDHGFDAHQTATRVVRADYCGDGVSWTEVGTGLQLEDVFGEWSFVDPDQSAEAIWTPDGAVCLKEPRISQQVQCANGVTLPNCGDDQLGHYPGALIHTKIWSEVAPES